MDFMWRRGGGLIYVQDQWRIRTQQSPNPFLLLRLLKWVLPHLEEQKKGSQMGALMPQGRNIQPILMEPLDSLLSVCRGMQTGRFLGSWWGSHLADVCSWISGVCTEGHQIKVRIRCAARCSLVGKEVICIQLTGKKNQSEGYKVKNLPGEKIQARTGPACEVLIVVILQFTTSSPIVWIVLVCQGQCCEVGWERGILFPDPSFAGAMCGGFLSSKRGSRTLPPWTRLIDGSQEEGETHSNSFSLSFWLNGRDFSLGSEPAAPRDSLGDGLVKHWWGWVQEVIRAVNLTEEMKWFLKLLHVKVI